MEDLSTELLNTSFKRGFLIMALCLKICVIKWSGIIQRNSEISVL